MNLSRKVSFRLSVLHRLDFKNRIVTAIVLLLLPPGIAVLAFFPIR